MRKYIIATHGYMASGMKSTLEIIIGEQKNLTCINAYTDECADPTPEFEKIINENKGNDIVIMTDMLGGSVNNNALIMTKHENVYVVTGINLATAITILTSGENLSTPDMLKEAVQTGKEMVIYCNDLLSEAEDEDDSF